MAREIRGIARPGGDPIYRPPQDATPADAPDAVDIAAARAHRVAVSAHTTHDGGGFALDTETLERLARRWNDFAMRYREALRLADEVAAAKPPGWDYASVGYTRAVRSSGAALLRVLKERAGYCEAMRDRCRAALGKYGSAEDEARATVVTGGDLE
ncbi:hypothetical protein B1813_15980 [Saccharomonospora piscinae]|uniref:Uncharacterized protein n=1 Tax=Saccharomonospora piscinae TaxID=687388 RepID=A0A1V9A1T4_SACPI|nr:hypothetical protein B1813_15980 [Saccharomonospora piscinae]